MRIKVKEGLIGKSQDFRPDLSDWAAQAAPRPPPQHAEVVPVFLTAGVGSFSAKRGPWPKSC